MRRVVYQGTWRSTPDSDGTRVLWRALTYQEFRDISEKYGHLELTDLYPMWVYLEVYEMVMVAGPHPSEVTAGLATQIAIHQLRDNPFSGRFESVAQKLIEKRNWVSRNYLEGCRAVVAATFHIPFSEMDQWDPDTLFERFAQAEHAVGAQWNPVDPNAKQAPQQEQQNLQNLDPRQRAYLKAKMRRQEADVAEGRASNTGPPQEPQDAAFSWNR